MIRFVVSELIHSRRFILLFILNLSLGLSSFVALEILKFSIAKTMSAQSKQVLGADFGTTSRRQITDKELNIIESQLPEDIQKTQLTELFSMASKENQSTLVQIKAIEHVFPFYGQILVRPLAKASDLEDSQTVWVYPEVLTLLNARVGDRLKIGDLNLRIASIVEDDAASGISTSMAPRVYMSASHLRKTNLLRPGTLAWYTTVYKIPQLNDTVLEQKKDLIYKSLEASDIQVFTHTSASEQTGRLLKYLSDFLGLVSLSALCISCIGLIFLLSNYLKTKSKSIAILIAIGYSRQRAIFFYLVQLMTLIVFGALFSVGLATLALPLLLQATQSVANFNIQLYFDLPTILISILFGALSGFLILIPEILKTRKTHVNQLLRGGPTLTTNSHWTHFLLYLPSVGLFYVLSLRQMQSVFNGSLFFICFLAAGAVLYAVATFVLPLVARLNWYKWYPLQWAIRDLSRLKVATSTIFLALSLGIFLINIVPQIKANLQAEVARPAHSKIPSLFLFDIQEEQAEELKNLLSAEKIPLNNVSPLIRARLVAVNEQKFDKGKGAFGKSSDREDERESQFRNRGFNLSYRQTLDASETLTAGTELPSSYDSTISEIPEISLEERFAKRLDLKMGDILTFEIQETPIKGRVTSLRRVNWTSFQPNFFVLFQNGSLDEAPKTYLATIPKIPLDDKMSLQKKILKVMPNVSLIDVDRLVQKLTLVIEQMSWALQVMSAFCILVGLSVLLALANEQVRSREWDIGLLKALGVTYKNISACFVIQFTLIAGFSALFGGLLSLIGSYIFSLYLFDGTWYFNWKTPIMILAAILAITPLLTFFAIKRGLNFKAKELLNH